MGKDDQASDWERYRILVPEDVREGIKAKLIEAEMLGYSSFLKATSHIVGEILSGNIPPDVAKEARSYLELMMTAIAAKNLADKDQGGNRRLVQTLDRASKKAKKQSKAITHDTTRDFIPDGLETLDGERIALEANWVGQQPVANATLDTPGE